MVKWSEESCSKAALAFTSVRRHDLARAVAASTWRAGLLRRRGRCRRPDQEWPPSPPEAPTGRILLQREPVFPILKASGGSADAYHGAPDLPTLWRLKTRWANRVVPLIRRDCNEYVRKRNAPKRLTDDTRGNRTNSPRCHLAAGSDIPSLPLLVEVARRGCTLCVGRFTDRRHSLLVELVWQVNRSRPTWHVRRGPSRRAFAL